MPIAANDDADADPFGHGVASGDPTPSSLTIWTAVPDSVDEVDWTVALDAEFTQIVAAGTAEPESAAGEATRAVRTLAVCIDGLAAGTTHHYRFVAGAHVSPTGRCSTLPSADVASDHARIGIASCARLASGTFQPYADLARTSPDLVIHLGDYIYEDSAPPHDPPRECHDAGDYHRRHAQYRRQPPLQELHRVAAWVSVWDDHDVADDSWRSGSADSDEGRAAWERRRLAAEGAYFDWLPQRRSDSGPTPMDRRLRIGTLADVVVLDARNAARERPVRESGPALVAPDDARRIISDDQWSWLQECVDQCSGWLILCTQTQVAPLRLARLPNPRRRLRVEPFVNPGQWDGYPAARDRLATLLTPAAGRVLLCSGDLHGRFHTALSLDDGSFAPEVTTPSIASTPFADAVRSKLPIPTAVLRRWLAFLNPHVSFMELERRGSTVLDVTPASIDIRALDGSGAELGHWRIERGEHAIRTLRSHVVDSRPATLER